MSEQANFSELRSKIANWDIEAEQMLINKLNIFTNSYKNDFSVFTKNMENLSNNLLNVEVEHYKGISNLKDISQNRFLEEKLEENADSVSEESDKGLETGSSKEIFLDDNAKMKKAVEISIKNMEEISLQKGKNKEQIEDDNVSVASKNIILENSKKYGALPFIIGTDDFMKDKRIGLTNEIDEEDDKQDENDEPEINKEILEDRIIPTKTQKRWDEIEQRRKTQKAKKEKAKIQNSTLNANNNNNFNQEIKEKVEIPYDFEVIESVEDDKNTNKNNETNNNVNNNNANINNNNANISNNNANISNNNSNSNNIVVTAGTGPGIPPPPPPPPKPVFNPANVKPKKKIEKKESKNNNINKTNNININQSVNINNNIPNNNINNNTNNINILKPKILQSVNPLLLQGLKNIKDDDDDEDDFDSGLFSKKNRKIPVLNNNMMISQSQNPVISPQTNIIPNNNNMKINKNKLNNIFEGIENEDDEEEQKVEEKKNNIIEPIKNNQNIFSNENKEEQKNEIEQNKNIFGNQEKNNNPVKQNMKLNNLFNNQEEEKNNTENIETKKVQKNFDMKKKLTLYFGDDDE